MRKKTEWGDFLVKFITDTFLALSGCCLLSKYLGLALGPSSLVDFVVLSSSSSLWVRTVFKNKRTVSRRRHAFIFHLSIPSLISFVVFIIFWWATLCEFILHRLVIAAKASPSTSRVLSLRCYFFCFHNRAFVVRLCCIPAKMLVVFWCLRRCLRRNQCWIWAER